MMVLLHFDWSGSKEELEEWDRVYKGIADKTEGAEYMGRFVPWNKNYHFTNVFRFMDMATWIEYGKNFYTLEKGRDYSKFTTRAPFTEISGVYDIYGEA